MFMIGLRSRVKMDDSELCQYTMKGFVDMGLNLGGTSPHVKEDQDAVSTAPDSADTTSAEKKHHFFKKSQKKTHTSVASDDASTTLAATGAQAIDDPKWPWIAGVCGFLCVVAIGIPATMIVSNNNYETQATAAAKASIAQRKTIESQIKELDTTPTLTREQVISAKNSAVGAGEQVADLQNQYMTAVKNTDKTNEDEAAKIGSQLDQLLADDSKNARVPWYTTTGKWRFVSSMAFSGNTLPVLWICEQSEPAKDTHSEPVTTTLAWAQGVYDASTNTFSQVKYGTTVAGNSKLTATKSNGSSTNTTVDPEALNKAIEALKTDENDKSKLDDRAPDAMSQKDKQKALEDISKAREQLQEKNSGNGATQKSDADKGTESQSGPALKPSE